MIRIGIIAEDVGDVEVTRELIKKFKPDKSFTIRRFVGNGCAKVRSKCAAWAQQLHLQGCTALLIIHDLDRCELLDLRKELVKRLGTCPITKHAIIIPIEEIEAWLMCDATALKRTFSLRVTPNVPGNPEKVASPKEKLESLIWRASGKTKRYLYTVHNAVIAKHVDPSALRKCSAFREFERFVRMELI